MGVQLVALDVNISRLAVLWQHCDGDAHLQAAWIFSATARAMNNDAPGRPTELDLRAPERKPQGGTR